MAQVIRVSLPTYDAITDTDIKHFSLKSDSAGVLLKEHASGVSFVAKNTAVTIAHNLGYVPFFTAFVSLETSQVFMETFSPADSTVVYADSTNLYLDASDDPANHYVSYQVYRDEA